MKLAMVLPLFSERKLSDYLGINLIVDCLRQQNYQIDCFDLNEILVDFILTEKNFLRKIMEANITVSGDNKDLPYYKYLQYYCKQLEKYSSALQLRENQLYDYFFQNIILKNFSQVFFNNSANKTNELSWCEKSPELEEFFNLFGEQIKQEGYQALLVSIPHYNQLAPGVAFTKKLKTLYPQAKIIVGGSTISLLEDHTLHNYINNGYFDYYVKYAAEEKLSILLAALLTNTKIDQDWLGKKDNVNINRQTITYRAEQDRSAVPILYSRGCYWGKCSYCTYIQLDSGKFTRKSLAVLLDELEQFSRKPVRISLITESLTPMDAKSIAEGILKRQIKIRWGSFIRVNTHFDKELFTLLKESGCVFSCVGVESINDKILDFFNKGYHRKEVYQFFQAAKDANYRFYQVNFIYGAPIANLIDELDNLTFISEFRQVISNIAFFKFEITENTYLAKNLEKYGIEIDRQNLTSAVRVGNIPFVYSLSDQEMFLLEQAYVRAGYYFVAKDIKIAIKALLQDKEKPLPLSGAVLFSHDKRFYLGSLRSPLLIEISPDCFNALNRTPLPSAKEFSESELMQFFELKLLNREATFWKTFVV